METVISDGISPPLPPHFHPLLYLPAHKHADSLEVQARIQNPSA